MLAIEIYDIKIFPKFPVLLSLNLEAAVHCGPFFRH